jgi:UTP--glucose-1-phosphate uridylyltransferase
MDRFAALFNRFLQEDGPSVDWDRMQKLPSDAVKDYSTLITPKDPALVRNMLNKLVVVKLNGGLGTSMGCSGPKSVIPVRNDLTFLDLTVQQIEVTIPYFIYIHNFSKIIFLLFLVLKQNLQC